MRKRRRSVTSTASNSGVVSDLDEDGPATPLAKRKKLTAERTGKSNLKQVTTAMEESDEDEDEDDEDGEDEDEELAEGSVKGASKIPSQGSSSSSDSSGEEDGGE